MTVRRRSPRLPAGQAAGQGPPTRVAALTALLVHDVGKYLARTARNLPAGAPLDGGLVAMLSRDLYGDAHGPPPAARFAVLAAELLPLFPDERLAQVERRFAELAALEAGVRAAEATAVARAVALALQIEQLLRGLACQAPSKPVTR